MAYKRVKKEWSADFDGYIQKFICDTEADIANLPKCSPGSVAIVAASGNPMFGINASGKWVKLNGSGGSGSETPGGGGVSSWNDLTDKPFYKMVTPTVKMEKQTVEIAQKENTYGTFFGGVIEGFGNIIESGYDDGKSISYVTNFNQGDTFVITIDGVEYEQVAINNGANGFAFGNNNLMWGENGPPSGSTLPFYIRTIVSGFELWIPEENVGTHEISIQVYSTTLKTLDEEFIPETIVRAGLVPNIPPQLIIPNYLYAGSTKTISSIFSEGHFNSMDEYIPPFVHAVGEYFDAETGENHVIPVSWDIVKTISEQPDGGFRYYFRLDFSISEPINYDIDIKCVSNYQFNGYGM